VRPIDFCTPKPFLLEHSCSVVSRRSDDPRNAFAFASLLARSLSAPRDRRSRPGASRLRARPRERLFRVLLSPVRRRAGAGNGRLGAARCKRDRGEPRFTARFPLRRPAARVRGRFLPSGASRFRSPLTPLSPPPGPARGDYPFRGSGSQAVARRPPRPVPREPRERRAHSRPRVPFIVSRHAHPGRAEARNETTSPSTKRGAHVMRIAESR